jgi:hypothetical protein
MEQVLELLKSMQMQLRTQESKMEANRQIDREEAKAMKEMTAKTDKLEAKGEANQEQMLKKKRCQNEHNPKKNAGKAGWPKADDRLPRKDGGTS